MTSRFLWIAGPLATSGLLLGACLILSHRFDLGAPPARGISSDVVAWLALGVTLAVAVTWLVGAWRSRGGAR